MMDLAESVEQVAQHVLSGQGAQGDSRPEYGAGTILSGFAARPASRARNTAPGQFFRDSRRGLLPGLELREKRAVTHEDRRRSLASRSPLRPRGRRPPPAGCSARPLEGHSTSSSTSRAFSRTRSSASRPAMYRSTFRASSAVRTPGVATQAARRTLSDSSCRARFRASRTSLGTPVAGQRLHGHRPDEVAHVARGHPDQGLPRRRRLDLAEPFASPRPPADETAPDRVRHLGRLETPESGDDLLRPSWPRRIPGPRSPGPGR